MKSLILTAVCLAVMVGLAARQPFERYQSILDRQMFGPLPPDFDPNKLPTEVQKSASSDRQLTQEQEKLQSAVHFSVLDVRPSGDVVVGFTDNSDPKTPRNYFLKVGESRDGWTVKEADPEAATMTVVKDEIEVSLSLGGNSAKGTGTTSRTSPSAGGAGASAAAGRPGFPGGSISARRLMRRQAAASEQAKANAAAAEKEAERQRQAEADQAQREADRAQREAERAEQRQQLLAIQEELKRVREAKATEEAGKAETNDGAEN